MDASRLATRVIRATPAAIRDCAEAIKRGALVAFPTDTVYGVGADAFDERAIQRLYESKLRPWGKAIPLLLYSVEGMAGVAVDIPDLAWRLAKAFLPGGLTLVLRKAPRLSEILTAGTGSVAIRIPDHPVALALIAAVGEPLAVTSANLSGQPSPVTAREVLRQLGGRIDIVLDGGPCPGGQESSVLDLTGASPRLLRAGAVAKADLEKIAGRIDGG
ncbi:MAG: threonylcarbamoyl-AMP synthase [Chloroflexi bacterium]|nr:threonylcarbamoyl-AMP synthase [Chloroflexota bacterium]